MNWLVVGFWNFELFTVDEILFFRCILCVKSLANPRLYLLRLIASWFLCERSIYLSLNSSGTCRWHFCEILFLDQVFYFIFGNLWCVSLHTDDMVSSVNGMRSSSSITMRPCRSPYSSVTSYGAQFSTTFLQLLFLLNVTFEGMPYIICVIGAKPLYLTLITVEVSAGNVIYLMALIVFEGASMNFTQQFTMSYVRLCLCI